MATSDYKSIPLYQYLNFQMAFSQSNEVFLKNNFSGTANESLPSSMPVIGLILYNNNYVLHRNKI